MTPYYTDDHVTLYHGDCLDVLRTLPDCSVDSVVTDPPYDMTANKKGGVGEASLNVNSPAGRARISTGGGFIGKQWDATGIAFRPDLWREVLRVLKPGGHLLAFGAPRTYHRMAVAIEDAGFEVRDSLMWLFGSGFPKSLDIGKAIDRAAGAERDEGGREWSGGARSGGVVGTGEGTTTRTIYDTPATPEAQAWDGWGTALKPAHEPIVLARKPLAAPGVNVLARVELELRSRGVEGEIRWTSRPASGAVKPGHSRSSSTTQAQPTVATSAALAAEQETPNGEPTTDRSSATSTKPGEMPIGSTCERTGAERLSNSGRKSSQPTATPVPAAESGRRTSSPSTTSTEGAPPTVRRRGTRSISKSSERGSPPATESFAGIATGLTGSWANVLISRLADGTYVWPDGLPRNVAGGTTVAANVLAWGVGGINVDGCRINPGEEVPGGGGLLGGAATRHEGWQRESHANGSATEPHAKGRWPANVILDDTAAAMLDQQSGESVSGLGSTRGRGGTTYANGEGFTNTLAETGQAIGFGDSGGASRFFYTPKADRHERPKVNGVSHPTVKPVDLMAYLVRLVTPRGGTVLDPFAGSGTTAEAATSEGCKTILIERESDYLPLIVQRLQRPVEVTLW